MTSRLSINLFHSATVDSTGSPAARCTSDSPAAAPVDLLPIGLAEAPVAVPGQSKDDLYLPNHYEAGYAYPLIVWLTAEDAPQGSLKSTMRRISDRNCLAVAVRPNSAKRLEDQVVETVRDVRKKYHVHSERIYLAGIGDQATRALKTGLARPEWFGGIIALNPFLSDRYRWLSRFEALQGKRVFLAADSHNPEQTEATRQIQRLLWSSGMAVSAYFNETPDGIDHGLLREIDRWMIHAIEESTAAA